MCAAAPRWTMSGNLVKEAAAPDVPTILELYKQIYGQDPSGPAWQIVKTAAGIRTMARCMLIPPNIPDNIRDILNKATAEMSKDPDFLEVAAKVNPDSDNFAGEALAGIYRTALDVPPDVTEWIKGVFTSKYGVVFE